MESQFSPVSKTFSFLKLPLCTDYNKMRKCKLREPVYPAGVIVLATVHHSEEYKTKALAEAIPEFLRFNIVESEVRGVC